MTCENFNKDIRTEDLVRRIPISETTTSKIYLFIQFKTERNAELISIPLNGQMNLSAFRSTFHLF